MKPLFITCQTVPTAGSEDLWVKTAVSLASQGHEVTAIVPRQWGASSHLIAMRDAGVVVRPFSVETNLLGRVADRLSRVVNPSKDASSVRRQRLFQSFLADSDILVVTQGGLHDIALVPHLTESILNTKCPLIVNARSGRGILGGVSPAERDLARRLFGNAHCIVVPTSANFGDIELELCVRLAARAVIHSPVKNSEGRSISWPGKSKVCFACPCRVEAVEKGLDLLTEAVALLADHEVPFEVSIYGAGPDRGYLEALVSHYGVAQCVAFKGRYTNLHELWSSHHALLLPSRSEGMPQSLMEAMFASRPAVATAVGGVGELVVDGVNGFIAQDASATSLAEAMQRCLDSRARLEEMGQYAARTAREKLHRHPEKVFADLIVAEVGPELPQVQGN